MPARDDGNSTSVERRAFLQQVALGGVALGAVSGLAAAAPGTLEAAADPAVKQYRQLGNTDIRMSDISFGGSRLRGDVDLVRHALDKGINYFDTAKSYTGGDSETVIGQALRGKRDQVYIASKGGFGPRVRQDQMMRALEGSLRRLQTHYVDVYFHHAVNDVARIQNPEFHAFTARAKEQGKIRYVGLSGHGGRLIECLDYAIDSGKFDVMLVAYNFGQDPSFVQKLTRNFDFIAVNPDLPRVLRKAKAAGMGVVAMKTLRGAKLNDMQPYQQDGATFSQAAFRWVLSNEDVDGLIVTMRSSGAVDEFLVASGGTRVTQRDVDLLQRYVTLNDSTYCRPLCDACEASCPENVQIADVLRHKMYFEDYGAERMAMERYAKLTHNAAACSACAHQRCLGSCPYGLSVPDLTRQAHRLLRWG
jgi:predicted aldo/keto reductase-like oxidoreductase